jgi:predicted transcriptional regulator
MSENAKEFIHLYNELDSSLKRILKLREVDGFSTKVDRAKNENLITAKQKELLLLVGRLRNAIIHDDKYKYPNDPIAEPNPEIITRLMQIKESIENPPTIDKLPKNPPKIFEASDLLLDCLQYMRQNDFSQVVVFSDQTYALITREDIARWFETQIDNNEIVISLEDIRLQEILNLDNKDDCKFLSRTARLTELIEKFQSHGRTRIVAVLITERGKPTEKPLNIFTQYDIPDVMSKIDTF